MLIDKQSKQVLCTFTGKGCEHDFKLFTPSDLSIHQALELKADKGYQGIKHIANRQRPYCKPAVKEPLQDQKHSPCSYPISGEVIQIKCLDVNRSHEVYPLKRKSSSPWVRSGLGD